ncbi:MAG: GspH/FimT family pseudopilin [Gammaproteobacteria bacterium]|nr:GspH/FimT family pseudopilin [Gammaproteobacteria bacterium]
MKTSAGFTLIELLIVVVLGAILLTIGVPSFISIIQQNRLTSEANDFVSACALARSEAIRRNVNVLVVAGDCTGGGNCPGTWNQGWTVAVDINGTGQFQANDEAMAVHGPLQGGDTMASAGGFTTFVFSPTGLVNTADTLTLCQTKTRGRRITIEATGQAVITNSNVTCP